MILQSLSGSEPAVPSITINPDCNTSGQASDITLHMTTRLDLSNDTVWRDASELQFTLKAVGNTASEGAKMALMSFREREVAWEIPAFVEYIELSGVEDFNDRFIGNLGLPPLSDLPDLDVATDEDRRVTLGVARGLAVAQRQHQVHEVRGLVAFERGHELLVVDPEGVRRVVGDRDELPADLGVLAHRGGVQGGITGSPPRRA